MELCAALCSSRTTVLLTFEERSATLRNVFLQSATALGFEVTLLSFCLLNGT